MRSGKIIAVAMLLAFASGWGLTFAAEENSDGSVPAAVADNNNSGSVGELPANTPVFVIGKNKTYHLENCRIITAAREKKAADAVTETTVADAQAKNFSPCKICIAKPEKPAKKSAGNAQ